MPKNHNKLNIGQKAGVAIMAGLALAGCSTEAAEVPQKPPINISKAEVSPTPSDAPTETLSPHPKATPEGNETRSPIDVDQVAAELPLTQEQVGRVNRMAASSSLAEIARICDSGSAECDGSWKFVGTMLTKQEGQVLEQLVGAKYTDSIDGAVLGVERLNSIYGSMESAEQHSIDDVLSIPDSYRYKYFVNSEIEGLKHDEVLDRKDVDEFLSHPATVLTGGEILTSDGKYLVVSIDGAGTVTGYHESVDSIADSSIKTPVTDKATLQETLELLMN